MKTPRAVERYCREFEETEDSLRDYIRVQKDFFAELKHPGTDLPGWIALKIACTRGQATQVIHWFDSFPVTRKGPK